MVQFPWESRDLFIKLANNPKTFLDNYHVISDSQMKDVYMPIQGFNIAIHMKTRIQAISC